MDRGIREIPEHKTRPRHIRGGLTAKDFTGGFGWSEAEKVAALIITYCQRSRIWGGFTTTDLSHTFNQNSQEVARGLDKLVRGEWLVEDCGVYYVRSKFIARCLEMAPAK